MALGNSSGHPK